VTETSSAINDVAEICRELATQLERAAELVELLELDGWSRHFRRDAELLRLRADHLEGELR
jgi:hypothetical protein